MYTRETTKVSMGGEIMHNTRFLLLNLTSESAKAVFRVPLNSNMEGIGQLEPSFTRFSQENQPGR